MFIFLSLWISFFILCVCMRWVFWAFLFALSTSSVGVDVGIDIGIERGAGRGVGSRRLQCLPFWFCCALELVHRTLSSWLHDRIMLLPKCIFIRHVSLPSHIHCACIQDSGLPVYIGSSDQYQYQDQSRLSLCASMYWYRQCNALLSNQTRESWAGHLWWRAMALNLIDSFSGSNDRHQRPVASLIWQLICINVYLTTKYLYICPKFDWIFLSYIHQFWNSNLMRDLTVNYYTLRTKFALEILNSEW